MSQPCTLPSLLSYSFKVSCFIFSVLTANAFISSAQTGVLDVTFGNKGKVVTHVSVGTGEDDIEGIVQQADGKIVAVGASWGGSSVVMTIVRYKANGVLDSAFGNNGKSTLAVGTYVDGFSSVAIQPDGKILAVGTTTTPPGVLPENDDMVLVRYKINGTLDSTFGVQGIAKGNFFGGKDDGRFLLLKTDGKILIGGSIVKNIQPVQFASYDGWGLIQFKNDGSVDSAFGTNGKVYTAVNLGFASSAVLQADNKIIVAGDSYNSNSKANFTAIRYTSNGSIDSSFGSNGITITDFANENDNGNSLAIQQDGKILLVGSVSKASKVSIGVTRFKTNGVPDSTFGVNGKVLTSISANNDRAYSVNIQPDNKILVTGSTGVVYPSASGNFAIVRYRADGTLDSSFGKHGVITTDFFGLRDEAFTSLIQPDGKFILAGTASLANRSNDFALARYELNTPLYYNTLKGSVYFDNNSNGVKDGNEPFFTNAKIVTTKAGVDTISFITSNGRFSVDIDTGLYVTNVLPYSPYYTVVPVSKNTSFATYFNTDSVSFAVQSIPGKRDLAVTLIPLVQARPGFPNIYKIVYKNKGTDAVTNGTIELVKNSKINFVSSQPAPAFISGDTLRWNVTGFNPQDSASIQVNVTIQSPPSVNIGDTLRSVATISSPVTDLTPLDNTSVLTQKVVGSIDPNDKTESHAGNLKTQQISSGDYLTYTIRFQNTGTDTAFNVYVKDTLNNKLDWSTLQMITASHNYQLTVNDDNRLSWSFNNINLVDSNRNEPLSHGYIVYRIKPKPSIVPGDTIKNTAGIYFDYNLPVSTNVERTAVESSVLPLKLTAFSAVREGKNNLIQWNTSQQINTDRFEVERSVDGRDYIMIGTVSVLTGSYSFTDKQPAKVINYYRLKTIDKDGKFEYSLVRTVNNSESVAISIYPNPVREIITLKIESDKQSAGKVEIVSLDGKVLQSNSFNVSAGSTTKLVYVKHLAGGTYFLRLTTGEQQQAMKFEKL